jgi:hypothetical protein
MRALLALPALMLASLLASGCIRNDNGAVLLHLDQPSSDLFLGPTYGSTSAAVSRLAEDEVLFTATSNEGILRVRLPMPIRTGDVITLPTDQQRVDFELNDNHWGNQGGAVIIISIEPSVMGLIGVPMVARAGDAVGSFVFNGNGTFRCHQDDAHCPNDQD